MIKKLLFLAMPKIHSSQLLLDTRSILGEGPVWDARKQALYWVDIEGDGLHCFIPSTDERKQWPIGEMVGAGVPTERGNLLLALETGLATFDLETETLIRHHALKNTDPKMRYNDGKVGPNGNFWIGSMHKDTRPGLGSFYRVDRNLNVEEKIGNTSISNGMAWTSDNKGFYYSDTATYKIWRFEHNIENGQISDREVAFTIPENYGGADGMCIDSEDMLWVAHWGGHCIRRWHPGTGEVLETVEVAAPHVTSCCFGGENLDTLYITTARSGLTAPQLKEFPFSGGLFACRPPPPPPPPRREGNAHQLF